MQRYSFIGQVLLAVAAIQLAVAAAWDPSKEYGPGFKKAWDLINAHIFSKGAATIGYSGTMFQGYNTLGQSLGTAAQLTPSELSTAIRRGETEGKNADCILEAFQQVLTDNSRLTLVDLTTKVKEHIQGKATFGNKAGNCKDGYIQPRK